MNQSFAFIWLLFLLVSCQNEQGPQTSAAGPAPEGMVYIPGGVFAMGGKSQQADYDELPRRQVAVSAFWMDTHEVTNREFAAFVEATGYVTVAERPINWEEMRKELPPGTPKPPDSLLQPGSLVFHSPEVKVDLRNYAAWWKWTPGADWRHPQGPGSSIEDKMDHPVVQVAWEDARAYAEWAGKRLPTEAEWEWAAMGGKDDPKYPWGDLPAAEAHEQANYWQGLFPYENSARDGFTGTAPVGSYPPNGYGLYDMAGNVWEWCADKYRADAYRQLAADQVHTDPPGPSEYYDPMEPLARKRVIRGGSFLCDDSYCSGYRVARRMRSTEDSGLNHTGFRCVQDAG